MLLSLTIFWHFLYIGYLLSRLQHAHGKKTKALRKKVCYCCKGFYGLADLTDLIGHIRRINKLWWKKSRWLDESAYSRTNKPWKIKSRWLDKSAYCRTNDLWRQKANKLSISSLPIKNLWFEIPNHPGCQEKIFLIAFLAGKRFFENLVVHNM